VCCGGKTVRAARHTTEVEPFSLRVPAEPTSLVLVRSELEAWLAASGVPDQLAFDFVAAASEATSNAIEHAQEPTEPFVEIEAVRRGDLLTVIVRDHGSWRPPRFNSDRNHGLLLIDSLMTTVEIDRRRAGTVVTMQLEVGPNGS
jgi:anti-sigma regulatory factor (Ser/Thr protein kinase)